MSSFPEYIDIKHSTRARRLALRLDPKARRFCLTLPRGMSLRKAQDFLSDHEGWMAEKLAELPEVIPFADNSVIPLCGEEVCIVVHYDPACKTTRIKRENELLHVHTNKDDPAPRIERYLKKQAKDVLAKLAHEKAAQIGKKITSITVRDQKTRWGSCAQDGSISLSWRLIFAPPMAMDYVVAHEVAHLKHMNHSKAFWNLCRDLSDDFLDGQYWIRNEGQSLMRFGENLEPPAK